MAQFGYKTGVGQQPHGAEILDVYDDGVVGLAIANERDDAVGTGVGALHHTVVAVDCDRALGGFRGKLFHPTDTRNGV